MCVVGDGIRGEGKEKKRGRWEAGRTGQRGDLGSSTEGRTGLQEGGSPGRGAEESGRGCMETTGGNQVITQNHGQTLRHLGPLMRAPFPKSADRI